MRNRHIFFLLTVLALAAFVGMALPLERAHAQTGTPGKIEGTIVNVTKDAPAGSTANLTVTLLSLASGATSIVTQTTRTDSEGKFTFGNLDPISTTRYLVTTRYADVEYYSKIMAFTTEPPVLTTSVSVYESTEDPSVVKILETHLVFEPQAPWLVVQQIIVLENPTDRVYINRAAVPHPPTLILPILAKAIDVQFDDQTVDQTTLRGEGVLTYTLPIGPGKDQILFQYAVPYTPPKYEFSLPLLNDVAKFGLYLVDVGATLQSQQLTPAPNPMGDTPGAPKLLALAGEKLTAGTTVKATLDKLPTATTPEKTTTTTTPTLFGGNTTIGIVVLALAAGAAVAVIAYPILRRRHARAEEDEEADDEVTDDPREDLLRQIAALDDEFDAGALTEAEYKQQRAALKSQLTELDNTGE
jgi:hypothetical protein